MKVTIDPKSATASIAATVPVRVGKPDGPNAGKVLAYTSPSKLAAWREKCIKAEKEGKPLPPEPKIDTSVSHHTEVIGVTVNGVERLMRVAVTLSLVSASEARESAI